jgi:hypothetical protein
VDREIINYDAFFQEIQIAFEGLATVFDQAISNQKIYVALLDGSGVETTPTRAEVCIKYKPMRADVMQLTTSPQTMVKQFTKWDAYVTTTRRPVAPTYVGLNVFDSTLGKPIWWNGTVWKDATGATV